MGINDIKKALYKEKPIAKRAFQQRGGGVNGDVEDYDKYIVYLDSIDAIAAFIVPVKDQGYAPFKKEMPAQLLIRWLVMN